MKHVKYMALLYVVQNHTVLETTERKRKTRDEDKDIVWHRERPISETRIRVKEEQAQDQDRQRGSDAKRQWSLDLINKTKSLN